MELTILKQNPFIGQSNCPQCGNSEIIEVWTIIDTDKNPELVRKLLNLEVNFFHCSKCGYVVPYENIPFVIHNPDREMVSIFISGKAQISNKDRREIINFLMTSLLKSTNASGKDYLYKPNEFGNLSELKKYLWSHNIFSSLPKASKNISDALIKIVLSESTYQEASLFIKDPSLVSAETVAILDDWINRERSEGNIYAATYINKERNLINVLLGREIEDIGLFNDFNYHEASEFFKTILKLTKEEKELFCEITDKLSDDEDFVTSIEELLKEVNDTSNLVDYPRAINICRFIEKVFPLKEEPSLWASNRGSLGVFLMDSPVGEKASQLEEAIKCFEDALQVFNFHEQPLLWAQTHSNLGSVFNLRIHGEKKGNIELAIAHFEKALTVRAKTENDDLAATLGGLGNAYLSRVEGDRRLNIEKAISYLEKAFRIQKFENNPDWWFATIANLKDAYIQRLEKDPKENTEKALDYVKTALKKIDQEKSPELWARMTSYAADVYSERLEGDKSENIEKAIYYSKSSLQILDRVRYAHLWANIQINHALLYMNRIKGSQRENFEQAILIFEEILEVVNRNNDAQLWGIVNLNYGGCLRRYSVYLDNDRDELNTLNKALDCYKKVLEYFNVPTINPNIWGSANHHLAVVYISLAELKENEPDYLHQAQIHASQALVIYNKNAYPKEWADTSILLGNIYHSLYKYVGTADLIEKAIEFYNSSLYVYTQSNNPHKWALVQHNLGNIYRDVYGRNNTDSYEKAKYYYLQALTILDLEVYPEDSLKSSINLGQLAIDRGEKEKELALDCFEKGITAIEKIRAESSLSFWFDLLQRNIAVYSYAIKTAYELGRPSKAFELLESSKSRKFLSDITGTDFHIPASIPDDLVIKENYLIQERVTLREQLSNSERNKQVYIRDQLEKNGRKLDDLYRLVETRDPDYVNIKRGHPFTEADVREFLGQQNVGTTIISFFDIPPDSLLIFCWEARSSDPNIVRISLNPEKKALYLANIFNNVYERPAFGMDEFTLAWKELSKLLITSEISPILERTSRLIFLPFGNWYLFPLHIILWKGKPLIEHFPVSFSPSLTVLSRAQSRPKSGGVDISTIGYDKTSMNPEDFEGEAKYIAQLFDEEPLVGQKACVKDIIKKASTSRILHISCHGYYDYEKPMNSGLILYDGNLTAQKVLDKIRLPGSMVCLSACLTGVTRFESGDERLGLVRAFLASGASTIVSSMWSVDIKATRILMIRYYDYIREGKDRDVALQLACLDLRSEPKTAHPFYWAPFILYGDWRN